MHICRNTDLTNLTSEFMKQASLKLYAMLWGGEEDKRGNYTYIISLNHKGKTKAF